ncbi:hypothetical protein [Nonomuraea sp. LPB2021202275-12-8]|uniref:hypothetical protein n=1 Tax=Nonomuraea sp. LPB2021202275-12-8 TaxID=3120159 RepID=UPI00300CE7EB
MPIVAQPRLPVALTELAATFRGMTAHPDEHNCECHWGSAEELALLKTPNTWLSLDLLRRTWQAPDWNDHASVLRRILPQLAYDLVNGYVEPCGGLEDVGYTLARGNWQQWPAEQAAALRTFLDAWWEHSLTASDAAVPAYEVLALCVDASGTLTPWLAAWETTTGPVADQRLAEAVTRWERNLLGDAFPWHTQLDEEDLRVELTAWLVRHAPARPRAAKASERLLDQVSLLGIPAPQRWAD